MTSPSIYTTAIPLAYGCPFIINLQFTLPLNRSFIFRLILHASHHLRQLQQHFQSQSHHRDLHLLATRNISSSRSNRWVLSSADASSGAATRIPPTASSSAPQAATRVPSARDRRRRLSRDPAPPPPDLSVSLTPGSSTKDPHCRATTCLVLMQLPLLPRALKTLVSPDCVRPRPPRPATGLPHQSSYSENSLRMDPQMQPTEAVASASHSSSSSNPTKFIRTIPTVVILDIHSTSSISHNSNICLDICN